MENSMDQMNRIKRDIVATSYETKEGHVASSFSILDILYVLYKDILKVSPDNINDENRNRMVLSKGHASIGMYAILEEFGFLNKGETHTFCKYKSRLGGHPDCNKVPGIEVSTGSLGHGLPMAVGIALGLKIQKRDAQVYAVVGDGEINEGSMWESLLLASHHGLNNLHCIIDYNHSTDRAVKVDDLQAKLQSFNWDVLTVDGHNHVELKSVLETKSSRPIAIIANTIKGNGCKIMENKPEWHHKSPTDEELKLIMEELK